MLMHRKRPRLRAGRAGFAWLAAVIALAPFQTGRAATLQPEHPALPAQVAAQPEKKSPAAGAGEKTAISKEIRINVFMLSDQPKNPDEVLESRGARYTYFSSRRLVSPARPMAEPKPRYPAGKKAERGGAVLLQLLINERGGLDYIDVVCSAPAFEQSAVESLRRMKFRPARDKDGPVKSYMWVEFAYGRGFPCAAVPD